MDPVTVRRRVNGGGTDRSNLFNHSLVLLGETERPERRISSFLAVVFEERSTFYGLYLGSDPLACLPADSKTRTARLGSQLRQPYPTPMLCKRLERLTLSTYHRQNNRISDDNSRNRTVYFLPPRMTAASLASPDVMLDARKSPPANLVISRYGLLGLSKTQMDQEYPRPERLAITIFSLDPFISPEGTRMRTCALQNRMSRSGKFPRGFTDSRPTKIFQ